MVVVHVFGYFLANHETPTLRFTCFHFQPFAYFMKIINFFYYYSVQVQFLDRHHLLIKFGSVDGGV